MKRNSSGRKVDMVRSAKMRDVIGLSIPPALAVHLAGLVNQNTGGGSGSLGLSLDLFESSDEKLKTGVFNAPVSSPTLSHLRISLTNVPHSECSVHEASAPHMTVIGKLGWNAVFDASAKDEIDVLPKPQLAKKKKQVDLDLITRQSSEMKEEVLNERLLPDGVGIGQKSRSTSSTGTRRGRGSRLSTTSASQRGARTVSRPLSGFTPTAFIDPSSSSSSTSTAVVTPTPAPWANRATEPRISTLRMPIRTRDDYDLCTKAYEHFCSRAQELRRSLLDENEDAKKKLRDLNSNTLSGTEQKSLIESIRPKRESISRMKLLREELADLTKALSEGKRHLQEYANGPVSV